MKKILCCILILTLVFSQAGIASAEKKKSAGKAGKFLDSIGDYLSDAYDDTVEWYQNAVSNSGEWSRDAMEKASSWAGEAWKDTSSWASEAWKDTSKWLNDAMKDSSEWIYDIWGDASLWTAETYASVADILNAWWIRVFENVTDNAKDKWSWIKDSAGTWKSVANITGRQVKDIIALEGKKALSKIEDKYDILLEKVGLSDEDISRVWDTLCTYASEKGIQYLDMAKLALPYLLELICNTSESGESLVAATIVQYLLSVFEKQDISSDKKASSLVNQLLQALDNA